MVEKLKTLFSYLHERGLAVPFLRDPISQKPSVSLTMLFISFNVVLVGLIGKWSKKLDIDIQQALYWFGMCSALYFSRKFTGNSEQKVVSLDNNSKE